MMRLLTSSTTIKTRTLSQEVARPKTIHTMSVVPESGQHLVVCQGFELRTDIERMLLGFAEHAIGVRIACTCRQ